MFRTATLVMLLSVLGQMSAHGTELFDPMQPPEYREQPEKPGKAPAPQVHYTLTSTVISPDRRFAVINGQRVTVGEVVGGARVLEIQPSWVRLRQGGRIRTVRLVPYSVKRPAGG